MTQVNEPPLVLKIMVDHSDPAAKLAPGPPISTIRGMCRGINTDVPNDADDLIMSTAAARGASVKTASKITLDDL